MNKLVVTSLWLSLALAFVGACDKPSEDACRAAVENTRKVRGNDHAQVDVEAQVRRCRSGSTKKMVDCVTAAKTVEELDKCSAEAKH